MKYHLTLVTNLAKLSLSSEIINKITDFLAGHNTHIIDIVTLSDNEAYDIIFTINNPQYDTLYKNIKNFLTKYPLDCFLIADHLYGIKKLLMFDMDSTLIVNECVDEIARSIGKYDQIANITREAMLGNLIFEHSLKKRVKLLQGTTIDNLDHILKNQITLSPGAITMAKTLKNLGVKLAVASGGFTYFTKAIKKQLAFDYQFANQLEIIDDKLTGELIPPIYGSLDKQKTLQQLISSLKIKTNDAIAVGDGSNDIPMLESIESGFAYHAKPIVNKAIMHNIKHTDLTTILFAQGIKKTTFVN